MPLLLCPNCQTEMKEVNRSGVQIDICGTCRGVWLDRGELEKLLGEFREHEREEEQTSQRQGPPPAMPPREEEYGRSRQYEERYERPLHRERYSRTGEYRKKSPFERLSDLFD